MGLAIGVDRVEDDPSVVVVALEGELDASNYEQVIEAVRDAYAAGARGLVFDFTDLSFMASSGLFALHSALRIMRGETPPDPESGWGALHDVSDDDSGENVQIAAAQDSIRRVLDRTGMTRLFGTSDSRDAAVAALRGD